METDGRALQCMQGAFLFEKTCTELLSLHGWESNVRPCREIITGDMQAKCYLSHTLRERSLLFHPFRINPISILHQQWR